MITVAYCGPIADRNAPAKGGMESGNRGLISELEHRNIEVIEFAYPAPNRYKNRSLKAIAYLIGLPALYMRLLCSVNRFDVLHLTNLYRMYVYPELLLVVAMRILRRPVFLHLRSGDWWMQYQTRSLIYKLCFSATVKLSQQVAVEGKNLLDPIRSLGREPIYVPSFVNDISQQRPEQDSEGSSICLAYVASLNDDKGLPIALETRRKLEAMGLKSELIVLGDGAPYYVAETQQAYSELEVRWLGLLPHNQVRQTIRKAHFFLFPTTFYGECHSNALNECMAEGVVPIASDHGANRDVVDDGGVLLEKGASPDDYAAAVKSVWCGGKWLTMSHRCSEIIEKNFFAPLVVGNILESYSRTIDTL